MGQLEVNKAQGKAGEAAAETKVTAEGYEVLGKQVTLRTPLGKRIIDLYLRGPSGEYFNGEVKTGGATRTPLQQLKDLIIETYGGTMTGKNTPDNVKPGTTVKLKSMEIRP